MYYTAGVVRYSSVHVMEWEKPSFKNNNITTVIRNSEVKSRITAYALSKQKLALPNFFNCIGWQCFFKKRKNNKEKQNLSVESRKKKKI